MGQNEPQVFIQCLILADYTYKFISLQCLGPFYSYDAFTLIGLLGYRSYIVVAPHLIIVASILQDISCSWLHMEIFGYFQEIMSKKCENSVLGKMGQGSPFYYIQTQNNTKLVTKQPQQTCACLFYDCS